MRTFAADCTGYKHSASLLVRYMGVTWCEVTIKTFYSQRDVHQTPQGHLNVSIRPESGWGRVGSDGLVGKGVLRKLFESQVLQLP